MIENNSETGVKQKSSVIQNLLEALPVVLALLVPIFYLPLTSEFFEFNKLALVAVTVILMLFLWVAKMLINRRVFITKSSLDLPIFALLATGLLATIFSLHKTSSLFGSQGRWFPSLFGMLIFGVAYYLIASNTNTVKTIKTAISAALIGTSVSTIAALMGYVGIKLGSASYLQVPNFTLTGSSTTASILASIAVILAVTKLVSKERPIVKGILVSTIAVNMLGIALLGSIPAWATLVTGLLVFLYFTKKEALVANQIHLMAAFGVTAAIIIALVVPTTRSILVNENYPKELKISPRESWIVASSVMRDFPILGTGPSTFGLNYTRYKPLSANNTDYWNIRFDKPYSAAFDVLGSLGLIGIVVVIGFVVRLTSFTLATKSIRDDTGVNTTLASVTMGLLTSLLFTYTTVTTGFLAVLFVALLVARAKISLSGSAEEVRLSLSSLASSNSMSLVNKDAEVFQYIMAVPLTVMAIAGGYFGFRQYAGEFYMRKAIVAAQENKGSETYEMQQRAIKINPQRASYHNSYANTSLALANSLATQENLSQEDQATVQALIAQAIRSSRVTTEVLNPISAGNWETRANVYRALVGIAEDAESWAVRSLNAAIQLDPANPRLRLALGGVYYAAGDYLSAANLFNQATSLKNDYANAHYNLAQAFKQLNRLPEAQRELQIVQRLVDAESRDYELVAAEIEAIQQNPTVAGAETKPTVEEIENAVPAPQETAEPVPPAPQEPLSNVGEEEIIEGGAELDLGEEVVVQPEQPEQPEENIEE
jgi:tetratricopeptide (TPR) repeat protein